MQSSAPTSTALITSSTSSTSTTQPVTTEGKIEEKKASTWQIEVSQLLNELSNDEMIMQLKSSSYQRNRTRGYYMNDDSWDWKGIHLHCDAPDNWVTIHDTLVKHLRGIEQHPEIKPPQLVLVFLNAYKSLKPQFAERIDNIFLQLFRADPTNDPRLSTSFRNRSDALERLMQSYISISSSFWEARLITQSQEFKVIMSSWEEIEKCEEALRHTLFLKGVAELPKINGVKEKNLQTFNLIRGMNLLCSHPLAKRRVDQSIHSSGKLPVPLSTNPPKEVREEGEEAPSTSSRISFGLSLS